MSKNVKVEEMNTGLELAIFLTIFVLIYALVNYFVLSQYTKLFGIDKNILFYIIVGVLGASYAIAAGLEAIASTNLTKGIYLAASVWMGILGISFTVLVIYLIANKIFPINHIIAGIVIVCLVLITTIYSMINAQIIAVRELNIYNDYNATLKIVQVSDIHLGAINGERYLKRVVDKINAQNPDVVLITGDLLDGRYKYTPEMFSSLNDIHAKVYFINGNHEVYAGLDRSKELLKGTKVEWLDDAVVEYKGVNIIGVGDSGRAKNGLTSKLYAMNLSKSFGDKYTILMTHRPKDWKDASKYVNLMVCGHTHAGQMWPFIYVSWIEGHASKGVYRMPGNENFMLYVNPGTGTWGPPMRLGSRTEMTVYNLKARNVQK